MKGFKKCSCISFNSLLWSFKQQRWMYIMVPDSCLALHSSIKFILSWPSELLGGKAGTISQMVPSSHEVKCKVDSHICINTDITIPESYCFPSNHWNSPKFMLSKFSICNLAQCINFPTSPLHKVIVHQTRETRFWIKNAELYMHVLAQQITELFYCTALDNELPNNFVKYLSLLPCPSHLEIRLQM